MSSVADLVQSALPDLRKNDLARFKAGLPDSLTLTEENVRRIAIELQGLPLEVREEVKSTLFDADLSGHGYTRDRVARYQTLDRWYTQAVQERP
jgi:hypothetical protein